MFEKVLIADVGEVAVRIARTCERMGVASVALVHPEQPVGLHAEGSDETFPIDPSADFASAVLEAASQTKADAIHPGYGPLSLAPEFARAAGLAGVTFIGPTPDALEKLGARDASRELALMSGVRAVHQTLEPKTTLAELHDQAYELGFPLLARASAGGRSARALARDEEELAEAVEHCRQAIDTPDAPLRLEEYVERPRVLEVELICDRHGQCLALGERECSIHRDGSPLLEESPSPALVDSQGEFKQRVLADASSRVALEGGLTNVGSAYFLMDAAGQFHFHCFRPRLSEAHALGEVSTGIDLVEWQLRVAAGERLPKELITAQGSGHALQARIRAQASSDPSAPRRIETLRWPTVAPGALRIESDVQPGSDVEVEAESLVAKVITYAPTRHQALLTLDRVLAETTIAPIHTNLTLVRHVLADEAFRAGQYDADFVERLLAPSEQA